ncbi:hypothetical protein O4H49_13105 [Kiloniella laminariae]|uniref:Phage abortive infection protein n=1 Tax=Kiloniella laminariae TaxID=454162 RepID=A0ABT4LKT1_9PROT|nr:putative phage abortive infection protein [Kiloniella laminariae]MCZ4281722.1 hypothetical protein [Kiloniella laminariae]
MADTKNDKETPFFESYRPLLYLGIFVCVIFSLFSLVTFFPQIRTFFFSWLSVTEVPNNLWGSAGDFFGGFLNPIVSFAAFVALIYTITLQQKELGLQRTELKKTNEQIALQIREQKLTTDQLTAAAEAQKEQSAHLAVQSFENTFFKLVDRHQAIKNSFILRIVGNSYEAQVAFDHIAFAIIGHFGKIDSTHLDNGNKTKNEFNNYIIDKNPILPFAVYLRLSYRIFKLLWENFGSKEEQPCPKELGYAKLFRAHFTDEELWLLFVNCLTEKGEKYRFFIIRYQLLDNFNEDHLPDNGFLRDQYNEIIVQSLNQLIEE